MSSPLHGAAYLVIGLAAMLPLPPALAATSSDLGRRLVTQGNARGATACASCHGEHGESNAQAGFPRLAGLNAGYLRAQLEAFQTGQRQSPVMGPIAEALDKAEVAAAASSYARARAAYPAAGVESADWDGGETLARFGAWPDRHLPACVQCHGPGGRGVGASFPAIAGQNAAYIQSQIAAWKSGLRRNDPLGLMRSVAAKLSDAEAAAVAAYFASLPSQPRTGRTAPPAAEGVSSEVPAASTVVASADRYFRPPPRSAIPSGPFGDAVRDGEAIFRRTDTHPLSSQFVGNDLRCENCHLDAGRLANSAPMWAAWVAYPAYRPKNDKVNTIGERIQGCFRFSMNAQGSAAGATPPPDSPVIVELMSYLYWLASGVPTGDTQMPGRGYPKLEDTALGFDPQRGAAVYAAKCALCHGQHGQGQRVGGRSVFPPLWGPRAYNWGAGMHAVDTAAAFIKSNMPLGLPESLSNQEAWDVAAFVNSRERPQDPRYDGSLKQTRERYHSGKYDYYGKWRTPSGRLLGAPAARR